MLLISSINIYPVKSLKGISLAAAPLTKRGFVFDREWMVTDRSGRFLTQRELPLMSTISTQLQGSDPSRIDTAETLVLSAQNGESISISLKERERNEPDYEVKVWKSDCLAVSEGQEAADFLSTVLSKEVMLVRMKAGFQRPVSDGFEGIVGFADGYPLLAISDASLDDLNDRLEYPIEMNRFRPNLTISGAEPFEEDEIEEAQVGSLKFRFAKPCARCEITTIDQDCGVRGKEPLRTLSTYRKIDGKINFGQNLLHDGEGELSVGQTMQVLKRRSK